MHLHFNSMVIDRFRSFLEPASFFFDDGQPGLFFLKGKNKVSPALGSNGAGKSSVFDAFLWCLYGKTVQGLRNPDIIPWTGKGTTSVKIEFMFDGNAHSICRTASPNLIEIDGKEASQEGIDKLLQLPFEIVPYTIILGQSQPLFFDLSPKAKLDLFMSVLNLERWEQRSQHAQEKVGELTSTIDRLSGSIDALKLEQDKIFVDVQNLKKLSKEWEDQRSQKLALQQKERATLEKQIASVMGKRDTADLQLDEALTELKHIKPRLELARLESNKLCVKISVAQREQSVAAAEQTRLLKLIQDLDNNEVCPTCQQPLKSHAQIKKLKEGFQKQIVALADPKADKQLENDIAALHVLDTEIVGLQKSLKSFEDKESKARIVLEELDPKITVWQAQIKAFDTLKQGQQDANNPYTDQIQELRRRSERNQSDLRKSEDAVTTLQRKCERTRFWVKGFKEIRLYIIEEVLQELEITTNAMCEEFGLLGFSVCYDVERETKSGTISRGLNVVVLSPNNKEAVKWECWSGGEGQRLRIIGALALSSVLLNHAGVAVDLEVLDEPTESLSVEGVHDLVDFLSQRARNQKKNIWFVDHHTVESAKFDQVVTVTKDKQGSHINGF